MATSALSRSATCLAAIAALLAGCGAPTAVPQSPAAAPLAKTTSSALLYVSGNSPSFLSIYAYPTGKLVRVIKNANFSYLRGACVNSNGDVFVTSSNGKILEYKRGSPKRLETLDAPAGQEPFDCSVDPTTGNLAVASLQGPGGAKGSVAIYAHAQGSPQVYTDPNVHSYYFCAYDNNGNLFVDGLTLGRFRLAELPVGSNTFVDISLNHPIKFPGSVMWDGEYLAVADQLAPKVYEFSVTGSAGTLVHTTPVDTVTSDRAFWIEGKQLFVADHSGFGANRARSYRKVEVFAYPAGGKPVKVITTNVAHSDGITVSLAPH
ncbi:MAG: hypothetical protein JO263_05195 [Candidatus Eremiobacteraeota bacterium]|nr:hypothetical protein [Candidatus Eremiobacteraeota bacterium]